MTIALSSPKRPGPHTPLGFTLVELVVITGCVGLLFAIVQPSLQATLGQSRNAVCLDRLRAIGQANLTYSADDLDGWAIPVHAKQYQQDPANPIIGAYEWGGKSGIGWDDWLGSPMPMKGFRSRASLTKRATIGG